jgi:hydroxyethylthiazole kinase
MNLPDIIANDLEAIRSRKPLIHSITNLVVMNETANAILCLGALPIMAHAKEEVEEMVCVAGALVLNIGTLEPDWIDAMDLAGKRANERDIPVILDPVGAGATRFRTESCKRLMDNVRISIVRGNAAEVATLAGLTAEIRGVESISSSDGAEKIAKEFAAKTGITAAITGPVDVVCDGKRTALISNGDAMMGKVVGTGCISNTIVASFAAVNGDPFQAAVGGLTTFGIAGEMAAKAAPDKPGTFHVELYNALYAVKPEDIHANAKVEIQGL